MLDLNKVMENVKKWTFEVGELQKSNLGKGNIHIATKTTDIDLVTEIDKKSEDYFIERIKEYYPDHSILSEESGKSDLDSDYLWVIDPLDGTVNYAQGIPIFAISIALQYKDETVLGVVYVPTLNEMFETIKGKGAFLNRAPISVARKAVLKECLLASGFPYDRAINPDNNVNYFSHIVPKVRGVRRMGVAAFDLANVAAGRLDGYWELSLGLWDVAAGILLIKEAGGVINYIPGKRGISLVAGNERVCELILKEIKEVDELQPN